jgi:hypothetical protein
LNGGRSGRFADAIYLAGDAGAPIAEVGATGGSGSPTIADRDTGEVTPPLLATVAREAVLGSA